MISFLCYWFLVFLIYSFVGYCCEIVCSSIVQKKLVNRGFLCGPYCPIYGVGSIFILFTLLRFKSDPIAVFILGALITSALEYFTSFVLEKLFHNKWWEYDQYKFNINGRICLQNTLLFGLGSLIIIYFADPLITKILLNVSDQVRIILAICFFIIFIFDCIYSVVVAYNLRNRIIICEELKNQKISKIPGMLEKLIVERVENFKTGIKEFIDGFDYETYYHEVYVKDKNGIECLQIY